MIYNIDTIVKNGQYWPRTEHPNFDKGQGIWVLARPLDGNYFFERLKGAWMVFTGKADVLTWTGQ